MNALSRLFAKTPEPVLAVEHAALRSDRFRLEREGDWKRLESIVTRMEKGRLSRLSDEDILALPVLYRTVASSLAIARETSLDAATSPAGCPPIPSATIQTPQSFRRASAS